MLPLTADQEIKSCNDDNSIECLRLLLQPNDLCNCGFVDPVATLTTAKSRQGDALVQLAECCVSLARLPLAHQLSDPGSDCDVSLLPPLFSSLNFPISGS